MLAVAGPHHKAAAQTAAPGLQRVETGAGNPAPPAGRDYCNEGFLAVSCAEQSTPRLLANTSITYRSGYGHCWLQLQQLPPTSYIPKLHAACLRQVQVPQDMRQHCWWKPTDVSSGPMLRQQAGREGETRLQHVINQYSRARQTPLACYIPEITWPAGPGSTGNRKLLCVSVNSINNYARCLS
jgi:hypothetical protein